MTQAERVIDVAANGEDEAVERAIRPRRLAEYVGQTEGELREYARNVLRSLACGDPT